jgi:hypothetical protein
MNGRIKEYLKYVTKNLRTKEVRICEWRREKIK